MEVDCDTWMYSIVKVVNEFEQKAREVKGKHATPLTQQRWLTSRLCSRFCLSRLKLFAMSVPAGDVDRLRNIRSRRHAITIIISRLLLLLDVYCH